MDDGGREGSCVFNSKEEEQAATFKLLNMLSTKDNHTVPAVDSYNKSTQCAVYVPFYLANNKRILFLFFWGIWVTLEDAGTQLGAVVVVPFAILR